MHAAREKILRCEFPIELEPDGPQDSFIRCMVPNAAYIGGFGSGKTFALCLKAIILSALHGELQGIVVAPTFRMLKNTVIPTFEDLLEKFGLLDQCKWRAQDMYYDMPWGGRVIFASADDPTRLRGPNLVFALVDEATLVKKFGQVFVSLTSRLRHPDAMCVNGKKLSSAPISKRDNSGWMRSNGFTPLYQFACCGTPEGVLDEVYDLFFRPPKDDSQVFWWKKNYHVVNAATNQNQGLSEVYLQNLMANIPEALRPALIGGQYIDLSRGRCYYSFDEDLNISNNAVYNPQLPLRLSWDFNLDPMVVLVCQIHGQKSLSVIDEISLNRSNTPEVSRVFIEKYGSNGINHRGQIFIYGDASGGRSTAEYSDYETIREYLETHFNADRINLKVPAVNPPHKRRVHSVNAKLRNSRGDTSLIINPCCWRLIRDLRYQRMDDTGMSKDKRQEIDGEVIGHAADCLDYITDYEWAYRRPAAGGNVRDGRLTNWYEARAAGRK